MGIRLAVIEGTALMMAIVFGLNYPTEEWKKKALAGGAYFLASQIMLLAL